MDSTSSANLTVLLLEASTDPSGPILCTLHKVLSRLRRTATEVLQDKHRCMDTTIPLSVRPKAHCGRIAAKSDDCRRSISLLCVPKTSWNILTRLGGPILPGMQAGYPLLLIYPIHARAEINLILCVVCAVLCCTLLYCTVLYLYCTVL